MRAVTAALMLSGLACAPRLCDDARAAEQRLLGSGSTCSAESAALEVLLRDCRERPACTADDAAALQEYINCVNRQQPCRAGNERVTIDGTARCNEVVRGAVSATCASSL